MRERPSFEAPSSNGSRASLVLLSLCLTIRLLPSVCLPSPAQVYCTDGLGSVRALTDGTATVARMYQTDTFSLPTYRRACEKSSS